MVNIPLHGLYIPGDARFLPSTVGLMTFVSVLAAEDEACYQISLDGVKPPAVEGIKIRGRMLLFA